MRASLLVLGLALALVLLAPTALADGGSEQQANPPECHVDLIDRPPWVTMTGCRLIIINVPPLPP